MPLGRRENQGAPSVAGGAGKGARRRRKRSELFAGMAPKKRVMHDAAGATRDVGEQPCEDFLGLLLRAGYPSGEEHAKTRGGQLIAGLCVPS